MMKRLYMALVAYFSLFSIQANDEAPKFQIGNFEFSVIDTEQKSVKVSKYFPDEASRESHILEFPNEVTYDGTIYSVTRIGSLNLFSNYDDKSNIYTITIPDNVEVIESKAFYAGYDAKALNVTIGKGLKEIGQQAFYQIMGTINIRALQVPEVYDDTFCWVIYQIHSESGFPDIIVPKDMLAEYMKSEMWSKYNKSIFATDTFNFADSFTGDYALQTSQKPYSEQYAEIRFVNTTNSKIETVECDNDTPSLANVSLDYRENSNYCSIFIEAQGIIGTEKFTVNVTTDDGNIYSRQYAIDITNQDAGIAYVNNQDSDKAVIYTLEGVKINTPINLLPSGVYIIRQNGTSKKIVK